MLDAEPGIALSRETKLHLPRDLHNQNVLTNLKITIEKTSEAFTRRKYK